MITSVTSPVKGSPSISRDKFVDVLLKAGSFAADALWNPTPAAGRQAAAREVYDFIVSKGHDPGFWLGIAGKEHTFGTNKSSVLWRNNTRSWTNARTVRDPSLRKGTYRTEAGKPVENEDGWYIVRDASRGSDYVQYQTVLDSVKDGIYRLEDPNFAYQQAGAKTVRDVIRIWAPASDNNTPDAYAQTIVDWIKQWRASDATAPGNPSPQPVPTDLTARVLEIARQKYGVEAHDIRNRMVTNGQYAKKPTSWEHVAVHYTGVWRERNTLEAEINSWVGHSRYHVSSQGWPGIAYAFGISPSGRLFGLRDFDVIGYHAFNANNISLGVSNDLTDGQVPTPEMKRTLNVLLRVLEEVVASYSHQRTWGHRELAWYDARNAQTICPGRYLTPMVVGFRQNKDFGISLPPQDVPINPDHAKVDVPGVGTFWIVGNIFKAWTSVQDNVLIFGYPLTGMFGEDGDDVQYFERAVLRAKPAGYWPDNFDVDFEAVGRVVHEHLYGRGHPPAAPVAYFPDTEERVWRPETRHSMAHGFLHFWRQRGGLKIFGWPITEEFTENGRTVQYFERARFEHHPGSNPLWFDVRLGRVGAETLDIRRNAGVVTV